MNSIAMIITWQIDIYIFSLIEKRHLKIKKPYAHSIPLMLVLWFIFFTAYNVIKRILSSHGKQNCYSSLG